MKDYLNLEGLSHFLNKLLNKFATISDLSKKVDKIEGKGLSSNDYTTTEKTKLSGIATGAEVNQNAFSTIKINATNISADSKTDTFTITAGNNITLTPDSTNDKVTITAIDTIYTHPSYSERVSGLYKITVDDKGHVSDINSVSKSDITSLGIPSQDTTYSVVTTSANGLMSSSDKEKLDGIAVGANKITVDSSLSTTSTNPVQNKIVNSALSGKVPTTRTINGKALTGNITLSASDVGADASGTAETKATNALNEAKSYTDSALNTAKTYTNTKVAELVNSAPETLDTLGEVAAAIESNESVVDALNSAIGNKVDKVSGKGLSTNDYTTTEKTKLSGIATGAEVNQNAFSTITINSTAIAADSKTDTFTITAGSNITLTPDTVNDKVTISATDTIYTHPSYTAKNSGLYKVTVDGTGHVSATTAVAKSDITSLGIPAQDTTYSAATTSAAGLMSAADKTKLDGIATGANKITVDSAMSTTSTNPVQNKIVNSAIAAVSDASTENYNNSITGLSISGKTITYTKGDGTTGTLTTQDTNTKVTQTVRTTDGNFPVLLRGASAGTTTTTTTTSFGTGVTVNPSTGTLSAEKIERDGLELTRVFGSLIPYGTQITASETARNDLNKVEYLKVGNYFCSANAQAKYIDNMPDGGATAFMMQVLSPLSTTIDNEAGTWVYRMRIFRYYTGQEYVQYCYSNGTAGNWLFDEWKKVIHSTDTVSTTKNGLMTSTDKAKLDSIAENANNYTYTLPTASSSTLGGVKIGTGIGISSGVISNSGVRSISTGSTNGTISVNTNGSSAEVAVKGLGSNAYTSTSYLPLAGGNVSGHIYLTGAKESSSTSNTSQLVFGTSSDNHLALSSNRGALVINKGVTETAGQIVLYLDKASVFPKGITTNITGNCSGSAGSVAWSGVTSKPSYYDAKAIKSITRSGTTFTYTCMDDTTGTFTQQDNNTTYTAGTGLSLSGTTFNNTGVTSINGATGAVNLKFIYGGSDNDWTLRVNRSSETVSTLMLKTKHSSSLPDGQNAWSLGNKDLAGDFLLTWYDENGTWVNAGHVLHDKNFTSYVTPAKIGAATSGHTHTGMYTTSNLTFSLSGSTLTITKS